MSPVDKRPGKDALDALFDEPDHASVVDIREWAKRNKPGSKTIGDGRFGKITAEAVRRMRSGEWEGAGTLAFVALYAHLHEGVYGCAPADLDPRTRLAATNMARRMLDREFDEDPAALAEFMRWCWKREAANEKWRRENARDGRRISWRLQFSSSLLTDYRVDLARAKARR